MDFCTQYGVNNEEADKIVCRILGDVSIPWLYELGKSDKRACFAWPHDTYEGVQTYKLADHFWIWKTLKALFQLGPLGDQPMTDLADSCEDENLSEEDDGWTWLDHLFKYDAPWPDTDRFYEQFVRLVERLRPDGAQRGILQRFTTESDISRKKILAVTRSPTRTRFLFHARDTSLFYGQDCGFFLPKSPFEELWNNTIEAQIYHAENDDTRWTNAIRYALGIMAGCRGFTLNRRSPKDLVRTCIEVLIRASSHNAFFPRQLDEMTTEPFLYHDERIGDLFHHAGFEINYILLTHARDINRHFEATPATSSQRLTSVSTITKESRETQLSCNLQPEYVEPPPEDTTQPRSQTWLDKNHGARQLEPAQLLEGQRSVTMKKFMPFNSSIDTANIVEIDEEWLYPYPSFFSTGKTNITEQINLVLDLPQFSAREPEDNTIPGNSQSSSDCVGDVIKKGIEAYRGRYRTFSESIQPTIDKTSAFVADIPKQKNKHRTGPQGNSDLTNSWLLDRLKAPRTAEDAKKRFLWLPHANAATAFICWVASSGQERAAISQFFDRHSRYEKYFWDDTVMVLNTWETELHLSFYVLVDVASPRYASLPPLTGDPFPGGSKQEICRASVSFRFDGDLFDRYWTCHYVEYVPSKPRQVKWFHPFSSYFRDKNLWQRKVLELVLLNDFLREVAKGAVKVLTQVRKELGVGESTISLSILDTEAFSSSEDNWHRFEHILHTVEEDLISILNTLQKWTTREQDRGREQPRWTRNDERKYRRTIDKYRGSTDQRLRDLEIHRDSIRKLKEDLAVSRQKIRDDRELRRNELIRYFTYVTVIFLPLGFAASFYSMNGPPENELLISLIKFAAGALAVTVGLLASAKTLFLAIDVLVVPLRRMRAKTRLAIEKFSRSTMEQSLLVKKCERPEWCDEQEKGAPPSPNQAAGSSQQHTGQDDEKCGLLSPYFFWLAYIFIEIPARGVLVALFELKGGSLSLQATANIVLGIVLMPVFALSWLMKIVFLNIHDVLQLLGSWVQLSRCFKVFDCTNFRDAGHIGRLFPKLSADAKLKNKSDDAAAFLRRFEQMTNPPEATRPLKIIQERVKRMSENSNISSKPEGGTKSEDVACVKMDEK